MNTNQTTSELVHQHAWNTITHSNRRINKILINLYGSFEKAWKEIDQKSLEQLSKIPDLARKKSQIDPHKNWKKFCDMYQDIHLISLSSPSYPPYLKHLSEPPQGLYIQGNYDPSVFIYAKFLSIVGTRQPSPYGVLQTQKLVQHFSSHDIIIVSGLADGIDSVAHESALLEDIPTWAVIGHGHAHLRETKFHLISQILKNGCIISEYPPETPPERFRFPERNRIIAGISPVTVVTEAPENSGANITAKIAREENREVFAITADIDRHDCQGNLDLIETNIATPLTSYKPLEEALKLETITEAPAKKYPKSIAKSPTNSVPKFKDEILNIIVRSLTYKHATTVSEIMEKGKVRDVSLILEKLTLLEIDGVVESIGSGYRLI
ncbi:DNA-protecting protein DprA [Candidatus Gracilibacteria bacterium]|nr:DNA-protecting protein DprA [Candidatus Gracilibacteria bacterium]